MPAPAPAAPAPVPAVDPYAPSVVTQNMLSNSGVIRAALLVPLSGPRANLGSAMSNAAQLALFDAGDDRFHLIPVDTKGTPDGARTALQTALTQGADMVLGPLFSTEVSAITPMAQSAGVPVVAFTTDQSVLGNGVYTMGLLVQSQVQRVVSYAYQQGKRNFALLARNDEYGQLVARAFEQTVQGLGARLVKLDYYDASTDLNNLAKRFTEAARRDETSPAPFDALMIADEGTRLRQLASMITYHNIDTREVKFLGTLIWHDPALRREPALQGAWYPAPPAGPHQAFTNRYEGVFGALAPRDGAIASVAYDATALAAVLAKSGNVSKFALEDSQGYAGVDGLFRLLSNGTNQRGLAIREIAGNDSPEIDPAPSFFPAGM